MIKIKVAHSQIKISSIKIFIIKITNFIQFKYNLNKTYAHYHILRHFKHIPVNKIYGQYMCYYLKAILKTSNIIFGS